MDDWSTHLPGRLPVNEPAHHHPRTVTPTLTRPAPSWMTNIEASLAQPSALSPAVPLGVEVDDRAAFGDHGRVGHRADVLLDPLGGSPRGLVRTGLVLADSDGDAALAAPKSRVAHEARYPADEVLDFLVPLLELLEQLRGALAGIAANDCVHHCLLGTRRGDRDPIERPAADSV